MMIAVAIKRDSRNVNQFYFLRAAAFLNRIDNIFCADEIRVVSVLRVVVGFGRNDRAAMHDIIRAIN